MACPKCGSWAVKADRSLSGRMVCARCGQVLGLQAVAGGRGRRRWLAPPRLGRHWGPWLGLGLLVGVSALLAGLPPRGRQEPRPPITQPRAGEAPAPAVGGAGVPIR